jgi:zinc transport system substrate-binding protein
LKKLLLILLFTTLSFATTDVIVSIVPQKVFVKKIGGDKVAVTVMVKTGASPHNYTPQPSQMKKLSRAKLYLSIGVEFEEIWLSKFANQNRDLKVFDTSLNIEKQNMEGEEHHQCKALHHHDHDELDPHVWVDPINVKVIAKNTYEALVSVDANNSSYYKQNLEKYLKELDALNAEIEEILKETPKESTFMVFHPSWGYFAKRYNLTQLAVEIEGKEPKMKALVKIIKKAKKAKVHAIFTQPEFSDKASQNISRNLNIPVLKASPLAENWAENLKTLADAIALKETKKRN